MSDLEAKRKEREQNTISKGPRWLWDWKWWVSISMIAIVWTLARYINHTI